MKMGHIWYFFIYVLANIRLLLSALRNRHDVCLFVCRAVMKDPGQANMVSHCAVTQSWGMFPWIHVLKSFTHEHKPNNLRKKSAN